MLITTMTIRKRRTKLKEGAALVWSCCCYSVSHFVSGLYPPRCEGDVKDCFG